MGRGPPRRLLREQGSAGMAGRELSGLRGTASAPAPPTGESVELLCGLGPLRDPPSILLGVGAGPQGEGEERACPGGSGISGNMRVLAPNTAPLPLEGSLLNTGVFPAAV